MARLNDAFDGKHLIYMMRRGEHFKVGYARWRVIDDRNGMGMRLKQEDADALWILGVHDTRQDALVAEALTQYRWNIPGWRFRAHDLSELTHLWSQIPPNKDKAEVCLADHGRDITLPLWQRGESTRFGWKHFVIPAANLMSGMRVLVADNAVHETVRERFYRLPTPAKVWTRAEVGREHYSGTVTSLDVETDHTYIADGIVTHNCLTTHKLAYDAVAGKFRKRLDNKARQWSKERARLLKINHPIPLSNAVLIQPTTIARLANDAVERFCNSDEDAVCPWHVDRPTGVTDEDYQAIQAAVLPYARKSWDDLQMGQWIGGSTAVLIPPAGFTPRSSRQPGVRHGYCAHRRATTSHPEVTRRRTRLRRPDPTVDANWPTSTKRTTENPPGGTT